MTTDSAGDRRLPPLPDLVAGSLFLRGVLLWMFVGEEFILIAAWGPSVPGS